MTHRGWLLGVLVILVSASLAGCLGGDDDTDPADTNTDTTDTGDAGDGNETADGGDTGDTGDGDGGDGGDAGNTSTAAPVAVITVNNTSVETDEELTFDASGSTDEDTDAADLIFSWDFGDGSTADGATATHSFATEGNFTVTLTVTDPEENAGTANTTIVVASGFSDTVVAELTGSITAPNPAVHTAAVGYGTLVDNGGCASMLECYTTFGGAEGTHFQLHTVDIPAGAGFVQVQSSGVGADASLQFAVFSSATGERFSSGGATIGVGDKDQTAKLGEVEADKWADGITIFVSSPGVPSSAYTITVTAFAEAPE